MTAAMLSPREPERLAALRASALLDSMPEKIFDDLALLASQICATPMALVSLVDENRQWFKSRVGLQVSQTPREQAFCAHAVLRPDELFVVDDAHCDIRFADNPLVTGEPGIRFYAGAPITTTQGLALGTVCVLDRVPRQLSDTQKQALCTLAEHASLLMGWRARLSPELVQGHDEKQPVRARMCEVVASAVVVHAQDVHEPEKSHATLEKANLQLSRHAARQAEFMHLLSHDLREPVNAIVNFTGLLREQVAPGLDPLSRQHVQFVQEGGHRLQALLDAMLVYAQLGDVDAESLKRESVALDEVMRELADDFQISVTQDHAVLAPSPLPTVQGDRALLRVLMSNLLSNALKFHQPDQPAMVAWGGVSDDAGHDIWVSDQGIGIEPGQQAKLFGAFSRLVTRREFSGSGLGLAICRRIVELHGGRLEVHSEIGRGSKFKVWLPMRPLPTPCKE